MQKTISTKVLATIVEIYKNGILRNISCSNEEKYSTIESFVLNNPILLNDADYDNEYHVSLNEYHIDSEGEEIGDKKTKKKFVIFTNELNNHLINNLDL